MTLFRWLRDLFAGPPQPPPPLDARIDALAARWQVASPVVWRLVQSYAAQYSTSMGAAADALQGLGYEEAREQVGGRVDSLVN